MAVGANPLDALKAAMLARALGGGQRPMGAMTPGGGPAMGPSGALGQAQNAGAQFASQFADLQGSDPGLILNQLKQMKMVIARMFPVLIERLPGVTTNLARMLAPLDGAIKEAEKAQQTLSTLAPPQGSPGPSTISHAAINASPSGLSGLGGSAAAA